MNPLEAILKLTKNTLLQKAKEAYTKADEAVGGWLPGGGSSNPLSAPVRQVLQYRDILRNPITQLKNPETYRAWQQNRPPMERFSAGEYVQSIGTKSPQPGVAFKNPVTGTYVYIPVKKEGFYDPDLGIGSSKPSVEIHFGGQEGNLSRAEARKEWLKVWGDRPVDLFGQTDPAKERARSLALRAQIGRGLDSIPSDTWINTSAKESPQNSRAKIYERMTGGVFAVDPQTGLIDVYKESPTTWRNITNPEKQITFDPRQLIKPLEREAFERPQINSLRETPTGSVVEAIGRRLGGPQVQAVMLLDDVIRLITGKSPAGEIVEASNNQLERSIKEQQRQEVAQPRVWQTPPF